MLLVVQVLLCMRVCMSMHEVCGICVCVILRSLVSRSVVCVCMYVCVYVCMYVYVCHFDVISVAQCGVCVHVCMYICMYV